MMRVNIEGQYLCIEKKYIRGIPNYMIALLKALVKKEKNSYTVSFFDKDRERNNRLLLENALGNLAKDLSLFECNELDFREIMKALRTGDASSYNHKSYGEYFGINADVYHFPSALCIPQNVNAPMVVTVHDMIPVLPNSKHELKESIIEEFKGSLNYIQNKGIICICDSESTKNDLQYYYDIKDDNVFVIPLGFSTENLWVDKDRVVQKKIGISKPFVFYLGALDPRKGVGDIVDAYELIRNKYDIQLVLAGAGEKWAETDLIPRIYKSQYKDDIILPGYITEDQKRVLLSSTEMFLFPSEYEGFGIPILEAMACGAPIITTNVSSIPEVGGEAVAYVTPHNPEELSVKMMELLDDKALRADLGQKGMERCKLFSWDLTAEKTEEVYKIAFERK